MTQTPGSLGSTLANDQFVIELLPNPWRYRVSPIPGKTKLLESFYIPQSKVDFHQGEQPDLPGFAIPVDTGDHAPRKKPGPKPKAQAAE